MRLEQKVILVFITSLLTACAELYESQSPAPILGRNPDGSPMIDPSQQIPSQAIPQPPPVVETKPLEDINKTPQIIEMQPELPPSQPYVPPVQQDVPPIDSSTNLPPLEPPLSEVENTVKESAVPELKTEEPVPAPVDTPPVEVAPPAPEPPRQPEAYTPLESIGQQTPAVDSLVMAANENSQSGNYDSAVSSIERAIRIEPRNAGLYYKLAVLRLNQSKPRLAEDIARKAALLAADDNKLKKHCWLLIANARELQGNFAGADKAKAEAGKY